MSSPHEPSFARRSLRFLVKGSLAVAGAVTLAPLPAHSEPLVLPQVGLGLWKSKPGEVGAAVTAALRSGYRLLDGAAAYANEQEVGDALAACLREGVCARTDLCVVSKLFNTHHVWKGDCSRPAAALAQTLEDLQLAYLDVYLMHWPVAFEQQELASIGGLRLKDGTPNPKLVMDFEYVETWGEMLKLKRQGKTRHLGVCNFDVQMLRQLMAAYPDDPPEINRARRSAPPSRHGTLTCRPVGTALTLPPPRLLSAPPPPPPLRQRWSCTRT